MRRSRGGLIAAFAVIFPQFSVAADLGAPVYKAPRAAYSWTGCYLGIEGGGAWGRSGHIGRGPGGFGTTGGGSEVSAGLIGGRAGCSYQIGNWVTGAEGDMSWADKSGNANNVPPFITSTVVSTREHWLGTIRGRVGFTPVERWLVYATGGFAGGRGGGARAKSRGGQLSARPAQHGR